MIFIPVFVEFYPENERIEKQKGQVLSPALLTDLIFNF